MYEESRVECDICGVDLTIGDNVHCESCYRGLISEIMDLKKRIEELEEAQQ